MEKVNKEILFMIEIIDFTNCELSSRNNDLKISIARIKKLVESKMHEIIAFINSIPSSFNGVDIMSDFRKEYYLKTFAIRFETLSKQ